MHDTNEDYRKRLSDAVLTAILDTSRAEGGGPPIVDSKVVVEVLIAALGLMLMGSQATKTPADVRKTCERFAGRLRASIAESKDAHSKGMLPGLRFVQPDDPILRKQ